MDELLLEVGREIMRLKRQAADAEELTLRADGSVDFAMVTVHMGYRRRLVELYRPENYDKPVIVDASL